MPMQLTLDFTPKACAPPPFLHSPDLARCERCRSRRWLFDHRGNKHRAAGRAGTHPTAKRTVTMNNAYSTRSGWRTSNSRSITNRQPTSPSRFHASIGRRKRSRRSACGCGVRLRKQLAVPRPGAGLLGGNMAFYLGRRKQGDLILFRSATHPNQGITWSSFRRCDRTVPKQGRGKLLRPLGRNNPHIRTADDAERLARADPRMEQAIVEESMSDEELTTARECEVQDQFEFQPPNQQGAIPCRMHSEHQRMKPVLDLARANSISPPTPIRTPSSKPGTAAFRCGAPHGIIPPVGAGSP